MATAREVQRQQRALEKAKVEKYLQSRLSETEQKNKELAKKEKELSDILTNSLKKDAIGIPAIGIPKKIILGYDPIPAFTKSKNNANKDANK